ncbi:hypothetical protein [Croceibacter atlanticus]|uniref:hypothetical protein n=1 Tax=Croceibacter atlanticus TaxID=313588 RepID=UPI0030FCF2FE
MTKFIKVNVNNNTVTAYLNVNNIVTVVQTDEENICMVTVVSKNDQILVNESADSLINKINSVSGL